MKVIKVIEKNKVRSGVIGIKFTSDSAVYVGDVISINYNEKERYFKVDTVETDENNKLLAYALNYGYYDLLERVDLRDLLELPVKLIDDQETLNRLTKESRLI